MLCMCISYIYILCIYFFLFIYCRIDIFAHNAPILLRLQWVRKKNVQPEAERLHPGAGWASKWRIHSGKTTIL